MLRFIGLSFISFIVIAAGKDRVATQEELAAFGEIIRKDTFLCPIATKAEYIGEGQLGHSIKVTCSEIGGQTFFVPLEYLITINNNLEVKVSPAK